MAAGLPGFGLSGVFFVLSALLMVPIEVVRTVRGRSSLARWRGVLRNAGIALAIIAGLELTYAALHFAVTRLSGPVSGAHGRLAQHGGRAVDISHALPVLPILGTLGLVALVLTFAKAAEILSHLRGRQLQAGGHSPIRRAEPPHDRVQPPVLEPDGFASELQPLGLAGGTSR
jgi:hypothetical protein